MEKLRYFDAPTKPKEPALKPAFHTEFLRTGRIRRWREDWDQEKRRYLTYEEVAERTGKKLAVAGETTHERINGFHRSIQFPKLLFHRTIDGSPHLGYCHITASQSEFADFKNVGWAFYIANFFSDIGESEVFFENINIGYGRMYFAVAIRLDAETQHMTINRDVRGNGILFRTHDPKMALKSVLLLGAKDEQIRQVIRNL
ncbi:DUF6656 family protein [Ensifer soli]|uniref:DUF6656 family protein n=1 Tax=Ciceribacter sp. sgz301302 TaxID=3342379 RepID=UPI0035B891A0